MKKFAASLAAASVALAAAPAFANGTAAVSATSADASYSVSADDNIVKSFLRTGAGMQGTTIGDASLLLDLSGYMSHPCFMPVGEQEVQECMAMFGSHYDLHEALRDGALEAAFHRAVPMADTSAVSAFIRQMKDQVAGESSVGAAVNAYNESQAVSSSSASSESSSVMRRTLDDRAAQVWQYCEQDEHRGTCFGRYARLVHDTNLDIDQTLGAILGVRAGQDSSGSSSSSVSSDDGNGSSSSSAESDVNEDNRGSSRIHLDINADDGGSDMHMNVESDSHTSVQY